MMRPALTWKSVRSALPRFSARRCRFRTEPLTGEAPLSYPSSVCGRGVFFLQLAYLNGGQLQEKRGGRANMATAASISCSRNQIPLSTAWHGSQAISRDYHDYFIDSTCELNSLAADWRASACGRTFHVSSRIRLSCF